jgi:hypothetical protein
VGVQRSDSLCCLIQSDKKAGNSFAALFTPPILSSHRSLKGRKMKKKFTTAALKNPIYVTVPESKTVTNTNFPRDGAERAPCAFHFNWQKRNKKKEMKIPSC